jgi:hypothetical protein
VILVVFVVGVLRERFVMFVGVLRAVRVIIRVCKVRRSSVFGVLIVFYVGRGIPMYLKKKPRPKPYPKPR